MRPTIDPMQSRRKVFLRASFALLVAPALGPLTLNYAMTKAGIWHDESHWNDWEKYWAYGTSGIVFWSYFGALVFAVPGFAGVFLLRLKRIWHYVAVGVIAGALTCVTTEEIQPAFAAYVDNRIERHLIFQAIFSFADIRAYPMILLQFVASGGVGALLFWLIVRPDQWTMGMKKLAPQ